MENNKEKTDEKKIADRGTFSRRNFLFWGGAAAAASFVLVLSAQAAVELNEGIVTPAAAGFHDISQFLTGKEIVPQLAERAWWALTNHDSSFGEKYQILRDFIAASNARTIDQLKTHKAFDTALRQTALAIISAYYLGYVGTPRSLRAHDDTIFITYTQALMYRLTYEQTPIPTYSRWESGYWGSLANPR